MKGGEKEKMRKIKGFTMIEMLIVIAVLGILAAALLATIDPFEQMKKARDTTVRNSVIDYLDAITRYYAVKGAMPWHPTSAGGSDCMGGGIPNGETTLSLMDNCTQTLIDMGELKAGFKGAISGNASKIHVKGAASTASDPAYVVICFQPDSKSIRNDPNTKCSQDGGPCTSPPCYWCTDVSGCGGAGGGATPTP